MADSDLKIGDQVRLEDHGTEPVTVEIPEVDGTVSEKTTYRRAWTAEGLGAERELAASSSVTTTTVPTHESAEKDQEQEQGLAMD